MPLMCDKNSSHSASLIIMMFSRVAGKVHLGIFFSVCRCVALVVLLSRGCMLLMLSCFFVINQLNFNELQMIQVSVSYD